MTDDRPSYSDAGDAVRATWGWRLAQARERAGLTAKELGERLGVQQLAVYRWESRDRTPEAAMQARIAEALGTTVTVLFPRTEQEAALAGGDI